MDKNTAQKEFMSGKKIRHDSWNPKGYICLSNGVCVDQNSEPYPYGVECLYGSVSKYDAGWYSLDDYHSQTWTSWPCSDGDKAWVSGPSAVVAGVASRAVQEDEVCSWYTQEVVEKKEPYGRVICLVFGPTQEEADKLARYIANLQNGEEDEVS